MLVRQLTRQLSTSLNSALSGVASAITRVLIDLSPTSSGFYSLGTDSVLTTAYTLSIDAILPTASTTYAIYGKESDANNYLKILSTGYLSLDVDGTVVTSTALATKDSKLRVYSVTLSGNDFIFKESGTTVSTVTNATAAAKTLTLNLIGKSNAGEFYFGILSNSNINGLNFALNQLTTNTETNNGVTATYQNIGTASTIRGTYTLTDGGWAGSEVIWQPINLQANWTAVNATALTPTTWDTYSASGFKTGEIGIAGKTMLLEYDITAGNQQIDLKDSLSGSGGDPTITSIPANTNSAGSLTYDASQGGAYIRSVNISSGNSIALFSVKRLIDIAAQPVTENMTLTDSWTVRGDTYTTLGSATAGSGRLEAVISNTDTGILMESGGAGQGLLVYVHAGVLYFQCGSGSAFGTSADTAEIAYTLPTGQFNYLVEWSAKTTNAALYINAVKVGSQAFSNSVISGGGVATVGQVNETVAVNRGGWTSNAQGAYTNTITKCDIFLNQVTGDL